MLESPELISSIVFAVGISEKFSQVLTLQQMGGNVVVELSPLRLRPHSLPPEQDTPDMCQVAQPERNECKRRVGTDMHMKHDHKFEQKAFTV